MLDPAAGTGTYPLTIASQTLEAAVARGGEGIRAEVATRLVENLHAFELLVGPYAVSHLRLSRTFIDAGAKMPKDGVNVFLTDTLAAPAHVGFSKNATLFQQKLAAEQERASKVKDPANHVTVVIGNPPYDRDESQTSKSTRRKGGMVRYEGTTEKPGLITDFLEPLAAAHTSVNAKTLYNDYVYFWRWAIWKTCEQTTDHGIVSFITASSYLSGPGFAGVREVMRRQFDELWIIDLGGEGRGARREENVFAGVLTPVAIAIGVRLPDQDCELRRATPATTRYRRVPGTRTQKLEALNMLTDLDPAQGWTVLGPGWADKFIPASTGDFAAWPALEEIMPWRETGTHFYRSWPIAENKSVLTARWQRLLGEPGPSRSPLLKESRDRKATKPYKDLLTGNSLPALASLAEDTPTPSIRRLGFRSFDRQWCIADNRVGDYLRPQLWATAGQRQVYLQTLLQSPMSKGPALVAFGDVPDCHAFRGSFGDKGVFPLWRDATGTVANITAGVTGLLAGIYGKAVTPEDVAAYIFGLLGTGAYTEQFSDELANSAARVPFTTDVDLFDSVIVLGRDLLWWATFGERFQPTDAAGKPVKRLPVGTARNTKAVPSSADEYPEAFSYDNTTKTIMVGAGEFGPVGPAVWEFEVSGLKVVQSWLAYRMKKRAGKKSSELDTIRPESWSFSAELVELLATVEHFVAAAEDGRTLLAQVVAGELVESAAFPAPGEEERSAPQRALDPDKPTLFN